MKNNKTLLWFAGIAAALGLTYIALNIYAKAKRDKTLPTSENQMETTPEAPQSSGDGLGNVFDKITAGVVETAKKIASRYMKYKVVTKETNLNVRQKPDGSSRIVSSLKRDSIIFARSSRVVGWMEVSRDGKTSIGFVSSAYLSFLGA